jgi:hypothetical protein
MARGVMGFVMGFVMGLRGGLRCDERAGSEMSGVVEPPAVSGMG